MLLVGLRHPSIVSVSAVIAAPSSVALCLPLMVNGDLKRHLIKCRPSAGASRRAVITMGGVTGMAAALADAMAFVEAHRIVHRDLAARNVLVDRAGAVKLADLGAARAVATTAGVYVATTEHNPVRWMAPEAMAEAQFSSKSDMWSFGVLLWEITALGETPHRLLANGEVMAAVAEGKRPAEMPLTPPRLRKICERCWELKPTRRPTFAQVRDELAALNKAVMAMPHIAAATGEPTSADEQRCPSCRSLIKWCKCEKFCAAETSL